MTVFRNPILGNVQVAFLTRMSWAKKPWAIKNAVPWYKNQRALSEKQKRATAAFTEAAKATKGIRSVKERIKMIAQQLKGKTY